MSKSEREDIKRLEAAVHQMHKQPVRSLVPLLPLILQLKGKPFSIKRHFPFEPTYRTWLPQSCTLKCARQLGKSVSQAAQGILMNATIPHLSTLYITPLFEQIRRFSNNYVRAFIDNSPVRKLLSGKGGAQSVMQRDFWNQSVMHFSFAGLDAERIRGISSDFNRYDEIQNFDFDLLGVIQETMSASDYSVEQFSGTPKSLDNTLQKLWQDSSQAEWVTKCPHGGCGHWNVPSLGEDLLRMIGPVRDDISFDRPGIVCGKCRKPIQPATGRWYHAFPERKHKKAGFHIPQQIMPMHYGVKEKWANLVGKYEGRGNVSKSKFLNEVCGESCDVGIKLVSLTELQRAACLPWKNIARDAMKQIGNYEMTCLAVDWGGGGEKMTSFTTLAVLGFLPDGRIDVIWGHRVRDMLNYEAEADLIVSVMKAFRCRFLAHDYGTSGNARETLVVQRGVPLEIIMPIRYTGAGIQNFMVYKKPTVAHPRFWYSLDRSRAIVTVCQAIRTGMVRFFEYDHESADDPGLINDFTALQEETMERKFKNDIYAITRNPALPDDFAHSVTYGCAALWQSTGKWPVFPETGKFENFDDALDSFNAVSPEEMVGLDWAGVEDDTDESI